MPKDDFLAFAKRITLPDLRMDPTNSGLSLDRLRIEVLSGLTVALALVPEAVAFAFVAHVNPLVGLYAAFIIALITSVLGGRPGMISGATGSIAVVIVSLVEKHGVEYLFAAVVVMGIIQIFIGLMRWGKFIRMVPHPVMLGFVNGLAIIIFLAQISQFKVPGSVQIVDGHTTAGEWMSGAKLWITFGLVALTMAVIYLIPRLTRIIPAPLAGIVVTAAVVIGFGLDVPRVGDMASISGGLPSFHIPMVPLNWQTVEIVLPYAVIMALVGLTESLLTLNLLGEMMNQRGGASQECVAQGAANVVTGVFGGMGGCAMIGQSMINVKSGARTRISGIVAALLLLSFILVASPLIEAIPIAALTGVMFMVVIGTFAWNSFKIMRRVPKTDAFVILLVTVVTVFSDLAIAVICGVIVSALAFAWNAARRISAKTEDSADGNRIYKIQGPLFFGSTDGFVELFDADHDPDLVIVDFGDSRVVDQSALQAIETVAAKYEEAGKKIQLRHLSRDCHRLLREAGHLVIDSDDDPDYELAVDYGVRTGILG